MRQLVIYAGRFQPFHKGHLGSYNFLTKHFGVENVYIATSNAQSPLTSPFSFEEKKHMMELLGIPSNNIALVKNPYRAEEITSKFDPADTELIFAVSEKDLDRFTFVKKDGTPGYIQPYPADHHYVKPMAEHAYVFLTPTINFKVAGKTVNSASAIRQHYINSDTEGRTAVLKSLYGEVNKEIKKLFDKKLAVTEQLSNMMKNLKESSQNKRDHNVKAIELALEMERHVNEIENADLSKATVVNTTQGHRIIPGGGIGSWDFDGLRASVIDQLANIGAMVENGSFDTAYYEAFKKGVIEKKLKALALYHEWLTKNGRKPVKLNKEITLD